MSLNETVARKDGWCVDWSIIQFLTSLCCLLLVSVYEIMNTQVFIFSNPHYCTAFSQSLFSTAVHYPFPTHTTGTAFFQSLFSTVTVLYYWYCLLLASVQCITISNPHFLVPQYYVMSSYLSVQYNRILPFSTHSTMLSENIALFHTQYYAVSPEFTLSSPTVLYCILLVSV